MIIITILEIMALGTTGFFLMYLATLSILASLAGAKKEHSSDSRDKILAVIIPAHNEELVIGNTIKSLVNVEYKPDLFDIIVVADNCTDETAEIARLAGAVVYERNDEENKGKGWALQWMFEKLSDLSFHYDAFVVIDADTVVSPNLLTTLSNYLDKGAQVIQVTDVVQPQPGSWSPEVTRIALMLNNYVKPLGRKFLGLSTSLRGNGMCFSTEILKRIPWNAFSITEDLEFGLELILHGVPIKFAPEAAVYARMPASPANAESQRIRWESGRGPVVQKYAGSLLRQAFRNRSFQLFETYVDLIAPAFVNTFTVSLILFVLTILLDAIGLREAKEFIYPWLIILGLGGIHVVVGLIAARADRSLYKALLYLPRYILWKAVLYFKLLVSGRPKEWIRTHREQLSLNTMMKHT
jgi:1,2-diacylglycerol 3-beta-glucosyltransferase